MNEISLKEYTEKLIQRLDLILVIQRYYPLIYQELEYVSEKIEIQKQLQEILDSYKK